MNYIVSQTDSHIHAIGNGLKGVLYPFIDTKPYAQSDISVFVYNYMCMFSELRFTIDYMLNSGSNWTQKFGNSGNGKITEFKYKRNTILQSIINK